MACSLKKTWDYSLKLKQRWLHVKHIYSVLTVILVSLFYQPLVVIIFVGVASDLKYRKRSNYDLNNMHFRQGLKQMSSLVICDK